MVSGPWTRRELVLDHNVSHSTILLLLGSKKVLIMDFEIISTADYANLPEDPNLCFVEFESICRRNMTRMINAQTTNDFDATVRQQYMAAVSAVALECDIPNVRPVRSDQSFFEDFTDFCLNVQGEVARIRIRQRGQLHPYSVLLTGNTRTKIEHYIARIRELVSKSDMDLERKKRLDDRLDKLAFELAQQRLSFAKSMTILVAITTTLAGVTTIAADGQSAVNHIMQLIGQDKESEDAAAKRLAPPPKALPAPQKPAVAPEPRPGGMTRPAIDEDIPF